jgi:hypothetical protein
MCVDNAGFMILLCRQAELGLQMAHNDRTAAQQQITQASADNTRSRKQLEAVRAENTRLQHEVSIFQFFSLCG